MLFILRDAALLAGVSCNYYHNPGNLLTLIKISQVGRDHRRLPSIEFGASL